VPKILVSSILFLVSLLSTMTAAESRSPRRVALIFDDGPIPAQAEKFLALLASEQVPVTFAYVARNAEQHPELARQVQAAGHEIANHSYSHAHPGELDDAALAREIVGAQRALTEVLGTGPRWYWPPFLETDPRMPALFAAAGLTRFEPRRLVSTDDWNRATTADQIEQRATTGVADGTLILCHEWREETLERLPAILAELRRQGCVFLTISQLADQVGTATAGPRQQQQQQQQQ
jgi:peptidoglycan/xylan/chitin deacetylase (PgdA/CDA1 family)